MRGALAPLLALLVLAPVASAEESIDWSLEGCTFVQANAEVDEKRVAPLLPPGFAARTTMKGDLHFALVSVEIAVCESASYGNWHVPVYPSRAHRLEDVSSYGIKLDTLISDDAERARLAQWGLPVHAGKTQIAAVGPAMTASLSMEEVGEFVVRWTEVPGDDLVQTYRYAEFTEVADGSLVRWGVQLEDLYYRVGRGTLEVPEGSAIALVLGGTTVPVSIDAGDWKGFGGEIVGPGRMRDAQAAPSGAPGTEPWSGLAVAFGLGGAGALVGAFLAHPRRLLPLVFLYTRLTPSDAAAHPRRALLLRIVRERPGIVLAELRQATGFPAGVLYHHLAMLEQHGLVFRRREGHRTRVFLVGGPTPPYATATQAGVLDVVRARPGLTQAELALALGMTRWSLAYHARRLAASGQMRIERDGRQKRYFAT